MLIATLLPDEIDRSYLGTVMRHNGAVKESEIVGKMAGYAGLGDKTRREAPCIELLSKIVQTETSTFVKQHTTLPFRRGITSYLTNLEHGSEENREMLWTSGMRVARPGAYCCLECMKEDEEKHGRSYWHREHQLPGLLWCQKHKLPLLYMENEQAFLIAPEQAMDKCRSVSESWIEKNIDNRIINTYLEISSALLQTEKPFSVKRVSTILKERAATIGYQTHPGKVTSPLLSDAVVAEFGREWLATTLPKLADKHKGEIQSQMDGVLYMTTASSSVVAYILALSLLFESKEEALHALAQSDVEEQEKSSCKVSRAIANEELKSAYLKSNGSYSKTASLLTTSYAAICGRLRGMGLPNLKGDRTPGLEKAAIAFFVEGKSLADSATVGNVTCDALENLVRVAGTTLVELFERMKKPMSGRGSGTRRPLILTPHEVDSSNGNLAVKFSPHIRREQRLAAEITV